MWNQPKNEYPRESTHITPKDEGAKLRAHIAQLLMNHTQKMKQMRCSLGLGALWVPNIPKRPDPQNPGGICNPFENEWEN